MIYYEKVTRRFVFEIANRYGKTFGDFTSEGSADSIVILFCDKHNDARQGKG